MRTFFFLLQIIFCLLLWGDDEQWYSSNSLGMTLQPLDQSRLQGWELQILQDDLLEIRTLYLDGVEDRRWELERTTLGGRKETFYLEGQFFSFSQIDQVGRLTEEILLDAEQQRVRRQYSYPQDNLIIRENYDSSDQLLYTEEIRLRQDGTLLSITRDSLPSHQNWALFSGEEEVLWNVHPGRTEMIFYNQQGLPYRQLQMNQGEILLEELTEYDRQGKVESLIIRDFSREEETRKQLNPYGFTLLEEFFRKGILVSRTTFRYTDRVLVEKRTLGRGPEQLWLYRYPEEDLQIEEYYLGGTFISRQSYRDGRVVETELDAAE